VEKEGGIMANDYKKFNGFLSSKNTTILGKILIIIKNL